MSATASLKFQTELALDGASISLVSTSGATTSTHEGVVMMASRSRVVSLATAEPVFGVNRLDDGIGDKRTYLYACMVQATFQGTEPPVLTADCAHHGNQLHRAGFGTEPHVTTVSFDGVPVALATHTDGMCQCGLITNNNGLSHCRIPLEANDDNWLYNGMCVALQYHLMCAEMSSVAPPALTP